MPAQLLCGSCLASGGLWIHPVGHVGKDLHNYGLHYSAKCSRLRVGGGEDGVTAWSRGAWRRKEGRQASEVHVDVNIVSSQTA
ncbi:hypothetical protein DHEL01_v200042 [Diaporthe helianthi]|uniref:Uncharacterized protein n=1 Tax=Diaporthe helianthi TaxID=158607 RepID=A0A2P5IGH0_DIAHE|nr:hypothetical protein DHEL01_v200042 [Diaporthe helianthi]